MKKLSTTAAFSLVEITLALGVAAFCMLAVFGLIPVGVQTNRNATSQTVATNIIASIVADLRTTGTSGNSPEFCIVLGTPKTMYFEREARCSVDVQGTTSCVCTGGAMSPRLNTRFRADVTFFLQNPTPSPPAAATVYANIRVTWPAEANPATTTPSGSVEMLAALNRN